MLDVKEYGNIKEIYKWEVVGVKLLIEIKEVCKQDYKKAQKFAIQGMHLDWYGPMSRFSTS